MGDNRLAWSFDAIRKNKNWKAGCIPPALVAWGITPDRIRNENGVCKPYVPGGNNYFEDLFPCPILCMDSGCSAPVLIPMTEVEGITDDQYWERVVNFLKEPHCGASYAPS